MKYFLFTLLSVLFFSCSPKVSLVLTKSYYPRSPQDTVHVYQQNEEIPKQSELLAKIAVYDAGAAVKCGYDRIISIAKTEALKIGGNGLQIINHIRPSFWGSTCHQIKGNILKIGDYPKTDSVVISSQSVVKLSSRKKSGKKGSPPLHNFGLNFGYAWIYNQTRNLTVKSQLFEDVPGNGFTWDLQYSFFPKSFIGFGAIYSGHAFSGTFQGITNRILLTYLAPMLCLKSCQFKNWLWQCKLGLGFLGYLDHRKGTNVNSIATTLGSNIGVGVEYKVNNNWGIGSDISLINGSFDKIRSRYEGYTETQIFDNGRRMGVSRLNIMIGLKYYIH